MTSVGWSLVAIAAQLLPRDEREAALGDLVEAASVSRRTLWVSASLCALPCLFCLARFRIESLSRVSLLLFLLPAILGVRRSFGIGRNKLSFAIVLALAITILMAPMLSGGGSGVLSWALLWPAWYLVAVARESGSRVEPT